MEPMVLVIDDNQPMLEQTRVEWHKYQVGLHTVNTVLSAVQALQRQEYVMIGISADLLGSTLSDGIRALRCASMLPMQVLASHYSPQTQAIAIKMGADQYLPIPTTIPEGVINGIALIRRYLEYSRRQSTPPAMLEHSGLILCVDYYKVYVYGQEVKLKPLEYKLIQLLLENKYRVLPYDRIFRELWGDEYIGSPPRLVTNLVSRLRNRLKVGIDAPEYIQSVRGAGYKFDPQ